MSEFFSPGILDFISAAIGFGVVGILAVGVVAIAVGAFEE